MKKTRQQGVKNMRTKSTPAVRASISFPPALYEILDDIAKGKKVSLAWVVRDAAEKYVARRTAETKKATPTESEE
ncbi:MAG: ribbon-helix-helix domain-containing protein [Candidatus Korobacteraceae bacterium]